MASARPPQVHLLSNGSYHLMVSSAGGGYSRWRGLALTRWREDVTCDNWGAFCYLRDPAGGQVWSTTTQPTLQQADSYEAVFSPGRATFRRRIRLDPGEAATVDLLTGVAGTHEACTDLVRKYQQQAMCEP